MYLYFLADKSLTLQKQFNIHSIQKVEPINNNNNNNNKQSQIILEIPQTV